MEDFENFKKKYEFNKYEQTSCIIYEMFTRAETIKIKFNNMQEYTSNSESPKIKDIYLYTSSTKVISLQNIIYNIYPELYIDALISRTLHKIHKQLIIITDNLINIEKQDEIIGYFNNLIKKIDENLGFRNFSSDNEIFEIQTIHELNNYKNRIAIFEENIENKYIKKSIDFNSVKDKIDKRIYKLSDESTTYKDYKNLINDINKDLHETDIYINITKETIYLNNAIEGIQRIIGYITNLQQEFKIYLNKDIETLEFDISVFNKEIQNDLNDFSFTINYLLNRYLSKSSRLFVPQLIQNPLDNSYIRITKEYVENLINNHLLNIKINPDFKRPIYELNRLSPLRTLHNINLSLPIEELISYMEKLKDQYLKNMDTTENAKYEIKYHNKIINVKKHITNLESAIKILYIYDNPLCKKKIKEDNVKIWDKLKISRSTYYLFKSIGKIYIDERKYWQLYNSIKYNIVFKK